VWITVTKLIDDDGIAIAMATTERDLTEKKRLEKVAIFADKFTFLGQLA
jgi:hypothetical protein